jgi:hypothetical protein
MILYCILMINLCIRKMKKMRLIGLVNTLVNNCSEFYYSAVQLFDTSKIDVLVVVIRYKYFLLYILFKLLKQQTNVIK